MGNLIRRSLVIATLFIGVNSIAQDSLRKNGFSFGLFISPDYSGINIPVYKGYYHPEIAFTAGLDFRQSLNKKLTLAFGVHYGCKRYKTDELVLIFAVPDPTAPAKIQFIYNDSYFELPLRLDYRLSNQKISPFITGGLSTNFFRRESVTVKATYEDGKFEKKNHPNSYRLSLINLQFQLGFGLDVDLKKTKLQIYPIGRISLTGVDGFSSSNRFYSVGLGVSYLFRI